MVAVTVRAWWYPKRLRIGIVGRVWAGTSGDRTPLLRLRAVTVRHQTARGPIDALHRVDLDVTGGQVLAVVGEQGSGRSTLAATALGAPVTAGVVERSGQAVGWSATSVTCRGVTYPIRPQRWVCDQIAEPMLVHGRSRSGSVDGRVRHLLERVGIPRRKARAYPRELLADQQHRLLVAMALACDPLLVVADDSPVPGLLVELLADRDAGLLLTGRDLPALARLAHRVVVLYAGRIVEDGPAGDVAARPRHPHTAVLAGLAPDIGPRPDPVALPAGCPFHPRCPVAGHECLSADLAPRPVAATWRAACVLVDQPQVALSPD